MENKRSFGIMNRETFKFAKVQGYFDDYALPELNVDYGKTYKTNSMVGPFQFFQKGLEFRGRPRRHELNPQDFVLVEFERGKKTDRAQWSHIIELPPVKGFRRLSVRDFGSMPENLRAMYYKGMDFPKDNPNLKAVAVQAYPGFEPELGDLAFVLGLGDEVGIVRHVVKLPETWPVNPPPVDEDSAFLVLMENGTDVVLKHLDEIALTQDVDTSPRPGL